MFQHSWMSETIFRVFSNCYGKPTSHPLLMHFSILDVQNHSSIFISLLVNCSRLPFRDRPDQLVFYWSTLFFTCQTKYFEPTRNFTLHHLKLIHQKVLFFFATKSTKFFMDSINNPFVSTHISFISDFIRQFS